MTLREIDIAVKRISMRRHRRTLEQYRLDASLVGIEIPDVESKQSGQRTHQNRDKISQAMTAAVERKKMEFSQ